MPRPRLCSKRKLELTSFRKVAAFNARAKQRHDSPAGCSHSDSLADNLCKCALKLRSKPTQDPTGSKPEANDAEVRQFWASRAMEPEKERNNIVTADGRRGEIESKASALKSIRSANSARQHPTQPKNGAKHVDDASESPVAEANHENSTRQTQNTHLRNPWTSSTSGLFDFSTIDKFLNQHASSVMPSSPSSATHTKSQSGPQPVIRHSDMRSFLDSLHSASREPHIPRKTHLYSSSSLEPTVENLIAFRKNGGSDASVENNCGEVIERPDQQHPVTTQNQVRGILKSRPPRSPSEDVVTFAQKLSCALI